MIALLLTFALAPAVQGVEAAATLEPRAGATAATGQPLLWTVTLTGREASAAVVDGAPDFGPEWAVLDGPTAVVDSALPAASRAGLQLRWTLMGLASGELETPALQFSLEGEESLSVAPVRIELAGALLDAEDAPRPLAGFRDVDDADVGDAHLALLAGAALLLTACLPWWLRGRRRAVSAITECVEPDLLEEILALDPAVGPAGTMGSLGPLLRRAVDEARGADLRSLTDGEWAESLAGAPGISPEERADLSALIGELSLARFGGAEPSSFAARAAVERAVAHVRALRNGAAAIEGGKA